jgi:hypothetical protein
MQYAAITITTILITHHSLLIVGASFDFMLSQTGLQQSLEHFQRKWRGRNFER